MNRMEPLSPPSSNILNTPKHFQLNLGEGRMDYLMNGITDQSILRKTIIKLGFQFSVSFSRWVRRWFLKTLKWDGATPWFGAPRWLPVALRRAPPCCMAEALQGALLSPAFCSWGCTDLLYVLWAAQAPSSAEAVTQHARSSSVLSKAFSLSWDPATPTVFHTLLLYFFHSSWHPLKSFLPPFTFCAGSIIAVLGLEPFVDGCLAWSCLWQ